MLSVLPCAEGNVKMCNVSFSFLQNRPVETDYMHTSVLLIADRIFYFITWHSRQHLGRVQSHDLYRSDPERGQPLLRDSRFRTQGLGNSSQA